MTSVGVSHRRKEGPEKLCGLAKYIDDLSLPGCLHGVTLRSTINCGTIKSIDFETGFPWQEYVRVSAMDIPGRNLVALIEEDQPLLADRKVMHPHEPILLLAHPDRAKAYEALKHIRVQYEALEPVLTMEDSLAVKRALYKENNVFKSFLIEKGDIVKGFESARYTVEGEYRVWHQEQAYIENNGMAAWVEPDGTVTVQGSMQCPYYIHKALVKIFGLPEEKIRVIQSATGGGFGGKEEYPSMIAGHAALLAWKAKKPVKIVYDRAEDMPATTKRHPAIVRHKTALDKNGKLLAQDIDVVMDGGAYATLSSVVLSRGTLHAAGPYECPNVRVRSRVVATNTPPNGAFRGFGAPQTLFAVELHMEKIARAVKIDSLTLRRRNLWKEGSTTATGQVLSESVGACEALEHTVKKSGYVRKVKEYASWNRNAKKKTWKGVGLSLVHHGAGFTGSGEVYLASKAGLSITEDGRLQVLAASTEIGQGTNTMFSQIAADALGVPFDWVEVENPDTKFVPNSGPTVASRTTMVVGGLVRRAALAMKEALAKEGLVLKTPSDVKKAAKLLCGSEPIRRFIVQYEKPAEIVWDDATYKGDAYGAYAYAALVADLEIDKTTFEVKINKLTTAQDIGKAVNPLLAEGQIIGGTAQGVGYALLEHCVYKDGAMVNGQFTNYIIPTAMDTPAMDVKIVEKPYSRGPFGAKGVGELPMDTPGPAIAAAVNFAAGVWITELPLLPERILKAINETQGQR
ncbi:MAG: xanthine dehydrogenase family protein [Elusimicrobia bacterium]|nr:xanthine dehydrogenase family protein [Elusimicrobiota bacterium]